MSTLPRISSRDCVKVLLKGGFIIRRRTERFSQLVVPDHKELDYGTLRALIRQAGITIEQFNEHM